MRDWAYFATAPNQMVAEMWLEMLVDEGIPAMLQPQDAVSFIGVSSHPVRLLVAKEKLDTAQKLLAEWESPDSDDEEAGGEQD